MFINDNDCLYMKAQKAALTNTKQNAKFFLTYFTLQNFRNVIILLQKKSKSGQ